MMGSIAFYLVIWVVCIDAIKNLFGNFFILIILNNAQIELINRQLYR
jgi:hypothetical protein